MQEYCHKAVFVAISGWLLFTGVSVFAEDRSAVLARQNYILNCQGCHLPDGNGFQGKVPRMTNFVGNFLHVEGGREFLVQVPGAANAPINDQELADVMNWLLDNFSREQIPADFKPYSSEEVRQLRKTPMVDINQRRANLLQKMRDRLGITEDGLSG